MKPRSLARPLLVLAAAAALAACHGKRDEQPPEDSVENMSGLDNAVDAEPTPDAPPPAALNAAPPVATNLTAADEPPPPPPAEQVEDDAYATGMTARVQRGDDTQRDGEPGNREPAAKNAPAPAGNNLDGIY